MQSISRIGRVVGSFVLSLVSASAVPFFGGVMSVVWLMTAQAIFGAGPVAHTALVTAVGLGFLVAAATGPLLQRWSVWRRHGAIISALLLMSCTIATTQMTEFSRSTWDQINEATLATNGSQFAFLLRAFCLLIAAPTACCGWLLLAPTKSEANGSQFLSRWMSFACGMLFQSLGFSSGPTINAVLMLGTMLLLVRGLSLVVRLVTTTDNAAVAPTTTRTLVSRDLVITVMAGAITGAAFVGLSRLADQLTLATLWAATAKWSALLIGLSLSVVASTRRPLVAPAVTALLAIASCCLSVVMFPQLVECCLNWSTFVESPSMQIALRCGLLFALFAPLGLWLGTTGRLASANDRPLAPLLLTVTFVGGYLLAAQVGLVSFGVISVLTAAACGAVAVLAINVLPIGTTSNRRLSGGLIGSAALLAALLPLFAHRYRPEIAAKLLFDTRVFVAHRIESRVDILPHLDEARCVGVAETGTGTLSQWRFGGSRLQMRQSGVLTAAQSLNTHITPQLASEGLPAILPLVLHEHPQHVAVLGLRSGLAVETALQFPVQTLTCVESDAELTQVVQRDVWSQLAANPQADDRLHVINAEPMMTLAARPESFDLIISNADQAALAREASAYTSEFYRLAARALARGGIFCQRFAVADVGAEPVTLLLETWRNVFHEVAAIETSSGEWLLVGGNSITVDPETLNDRPIVADRVGAICLPSGLVERLQRPHVRRAFSAIGADWSAPLLLSTMLFQQSDREPANSLLPINTAKSCTLTARLPWDVLRWGNKLGEINEVYTSQTQTLGARLGEEAATDEITRRLTEVALQRQIVAQHPDEYWAYRKSVKKRLTESPQSTIVQVKGERPTKDLHPNEKRRMSYFETLGVAAKAASPSSDQLAAVVAFAEPHDPLISSFLHQEVAELASKNSDKFASLEWEHRLQAINFAEPNDRSVRNVVSAIELLCQHPEFIEDAAQRGDQLDSLLQVLHARWLARGDLTPATSQIMLSDLEHSITAIDHAFVALDELREARSLSVADWDARRTALEKSLVRPLRHYRSVLAPHHAKERKAAN